MAKQKFGKIIIPASANPWPHEINTALALSHAGYSVEFIPETNIKTPDIYLRKTPFEIKSPVTNDPKKIIRNVKRALEKCPNVIIDSSRIKSLGDKNIERMLACKAKDLPKLKRLLFIDKHGCVIDIMSKI